MLQISNWLVQAINLARNPFKRVGVDHTKRVLLGLVKLGEAQRP